MSDSELLSHFTPLDELIQVIYQGSARFVILSSVDDEQWRVHVGLTGHEGRWWRGQWTDKEVRETVGAKVSSFLLESFVEKMADAFVNGDLTLEDWTSAKGAKIELLLGKNVKTPIRIPLIELSPEDGAAFATKVFAEIALQAQSRRCRLHSSMLDVSKTAANPAPVPGSSSGNAAPSPVPDQVKKKARHSSPPKDKEKSSANKIKRVQEAAAKNMKREQGSAAIMTNSSRLLPVNKVSAIARPKGASLANPTKKARKYQAIEFESDEE